MCFVAVTKHLWIPTGSEGKEMTSKLQIRLVGLAGILLGTVTVAGHAQSVVQNLTINLTAYDHVEARQIKITTKDLIRYFAQTNVPGARLLLVTPSPNEPGTLGNLN